MAHSMQLASGSDTFVAGSLNSNFTENGGVSTFSKQTQLKGQTYFQKNGDWVQVQSSLSDTFAVQVGTTAYSMQLASGSDTFVAGSLNSNFSENGGVSTFSKQTQLKGQTYFQKNGDWVQVQSSLSDTFAVQVGTTAYSMQLASGSDTFVAGSLNSNFTENGGVSTVSKRTQLKGQTYFQKNGDCVQVQSSLSDTVAVQVGTTAYSMQLASGSDTFVAGSLNSNFT